MPGFSTMALPALSANGRPILNAAPPAPRVTGADGSTGTLTAAFATVAWIALVPVARVGTFAASETAVGSALTSAARGSFAAPAGAAVSTVSTSAVAPMV